MIWGTSDHPKAAILQKERKAPRKIQALVGYCLILASLSVSPFDNCCEVKPGNRRQKNQAVVGCMGLLLWDVWLTHESRFISKQAPMPWPMLSAAKAKYMPIRASRLEVSVNIGVQMLAFFSCSMFRSPCQPQQKPQSDLMAAMKFTSKAHASLHSDTWNSKGLLECIWLLFSRASVPKNPVTWCVEREKIHLWWF